MAVQRYEEGEEEEEDKQGRGEYHIMDMAKEEDVPRLTIAGV
eukprot:CAMPEP_0206564990 /NCGR_PEP_ID=MMETSP0325_2-20121206/23800_1 /ASSEMBLY_ACC=CAM_ASM_000347 /TAXON_ID=2866 /ORGANISM="Crypthecodinium cohnii, Strain Seligo" /LENGTH=41 /DNA_ID= /DNA_START= /DNA_END= /DNA_ORIENTATION=